MTLQELYDWHVAQLTECDQQTKTATKKANDMRCSIRTTMQWSRDEQRLKHRAELHVNACKVLREVIHG